MARMVANPTDQEIVRQTRLVISAHASVVSASKKRDTREDVDALVAARQELFRIKRQWSDMTGVPL